MYASYVRIVKYKIHAIQKNKEAVVERSLLDGSLNSISSLLLLNIPIPS